METIFNESVSNLPVGTRESLEAVLGRHLEPQQRVFIQVFDPNAVPDEAHRRAALASLERTFAQSDRYASQRGITAEEADEAVEEALEFVRRNPS
jgi:hypothetical protein